MNFGEAIEALKQGKAVQRTGWNGKNMYIYLEEDTDVILGRGYSGSRKRHYEPVIVLFTAQGTHQPGWVSSQPDILAEDWQVVERP